MQLLLLRGPQIPGQKVSLLAEGQAPALNSQYAGSTPGENHVRNCSEVVLYQLNSIDY